MSYEKRIIEKHREKISHYLRDGWSMNVSQVKAIGASNNAVLKAMRADKELQRIREEYVSNQREKA